MSVFGFYAEVNLGCVCLLLLLWYTIKKLPTPQPKYELFRTLVLWHILYFLSDSAWALVNNATIPKNIFSVLIVNYLNVFILPMVAYSCFMFAEIGTRADMTRKQIEHLQRLLKIPIIVQDVGLFISFVVVPDFWIDDKLEPVDLYYVVLSLLPLLYWIAATVRGLARVRNAQNRPNLRTYLIVSSYTPGVLIAGGAQIFFAMTSPIFCFWCTFIILFAYLHLQNQLISMDPLTMLNNRNRLNDYLRQQHEVEDSYVIMVDVDHFKQINDTYGHAEGDRALIVVSQALKKACERLNFSIFLCRYGGDEFLLIAHTDAPDEVVQKIKACLQEEISVQEGKRSYNIEVSVGYARWDGNSENFKECMINADKKMYEDKRLA